MRSSCIVLPFLAASVLAAPPPVTDPTFMQAAVVIGAVDVLADECERSGGFSPAQRRIIDEWTRSQGVDRLRARLPELATQATAQQQVTQAVNLIVQGLRGQGLAPCPAATSTTRLPMAQFASSAPQLFADASPAPPPAVAAAPAAGAADTLAALDSIGFHSRATMGVGGFIGLDVFPVLLLRSGELVRDVEALATPGGLAAHRGAHPASWTTWRRHAGKVELQTSEGWKPLHFQTTYRELPGNLRLNGLYRARGGVGNVALGGSDSVAVWDEYRFTPDGRVTRSGGSGSTAAFGDASVTTSNTRGPRGGRYRVEGLTLVIDYDDGRQERRILVVDPADPGKALWLDGQGYVQRR